MIKDYAASLWQDLTDTRQARFIIVGGLLLVILGIGYGAYTAYSQSAEEQAYRAFAESYEFYGQALTQQFSKDESDKSAALWQEAELAFRSGARQFPRSTLVPFFLAFHAEALVQLGRRAEALEVMDNLVTGHGTSLLYPLYACKRALIKMDDPTRLQEGITELTALADDPSNKNRDQALYYLGEYYWSQGDTTRAYARWHEIEVLRTQGTTPTPSPWYELVKERMSQQPTP